MRSSLSRILVTGGAGFIGSHIVDRLIKEGYEVGVLDNFSTGEEKNLSNSNSIKVHRCDVSNYESVQSVVKDYKAIIHQAALVSVTRSIEDPISVSRVNTTGTINILKAAVDSNIQRFIYASSSSVYGETETLPKRESMNPSPISPYAASKLAAENYCRVFGKVYGLHTVCLRYFNVYGPRQKYGPYSGVIPIFLERVTEDEPPTIYGDGEQTRDFTYVEDVVQANMLCLKNQVREGEVFNIATGRATSISGLAGLIINLMGKPHLGVQHAHSREGDIRHSYADISKASSALGYRPSVSIEDGLRRVIEWFLAKSDGK